MNNLFIPDSITPQDSDSPTSCGGCGTSSCGYNTWQTGEGPTTCTGNCWVRCASSCDTTCVAVCVDVCKSNCTNFCNGFMFFV